MKNPKQLLLKNIFSNWASMVVTAAIAFFMSPFLVHNLGKEQYGIWALVFSIVAYMDFFDAGMKQSLARYMPKYYAVGDYPKLNQVINSSLLIYGITGTLVMIATLVIAFFFIDIFNVSAALMPIMRLTLIIIGLNHACYFFFLTLTALGPFHRYDILNATNITRNILRAVVIVYFVRLGHGLVAVALITLIASLATFIVKRVIQQRLVPQIEIGIRHVSKKCIRELYQYGAISFAIVMSWVVIFNTDNIIIGAFLTAEAVTYYSIAGIIISYLRASISAIGVPLVPAISHLDATSRSDEIAELYGKMTGYLYYLTTSVCVITLFFGGPFIHLWMGPGFERTIDILYILIIPAAIYLPQVMGNSVLLGIGKHKALLYVLGGEAVGNIVLSIILVRYLGIYGVALGTVIPQLIIYIFVYPYVFHRVIRRRVRPFYVKNAGMVMTGLLFTVPPAFLVKSFLPLSGWPGLIIGVLVVGVLVIVGLYWKVLRSEDRRRILKAFRE